MTRIIYPTEHEIQKSILDYLAASRIFHYRNNTGAFKSEYKGRKRFIQFGAKGSPDIIAVINGIYVGIEVKDHKGSQNVNQINFQKDLENAGGKYILARSVDDVILYIEHTER